MKEVQQGQRKGVKLKINHFNWGPREQVKIHLKHAIKWRKCSENEFETSSNEKLKHICLISLPVPRWRIFQSISLSGGTYWQEGRGVTSDTVHTADALSWSPLNSAGAAMLSLSPAKHANWCPQHIGCLSPIPHSLPCSPLLPSAAEFRAYQESVKFVPKYVMPVVLVIETMQSLNYSYTSDMQV